MQAGDKAYREVYKYRLLPQSSAIPNHFVILQKFSQYKESLDTIRQRTHEYLQMLRWALESYWALAD